MFRLAAPQWLLLLPIFGLLAWWLRGARLWRPLRAVGLLLIVLFLARPEIRRTATGLDLWVLMDRSTSAQDSVEPRRAELERLIEAGKGPGDHLYYVDFAAYPVVRDSTAAFESSLTQTRLRLAAEYALGLRKTGRSTRMLAVTDGYSTESLAGLASRFREAGVPLDLRLIEPESRDDYRVEMIKAPQRVRPGEGFLVEVLATGSSDGDVPYEILCDGAKAGQGLMNFRGGRASVRFSARSTQPGARRYEVRLLPAKDARPGNNSAWCWVEVSGGQSVLLITGYNDDPLAAVLEAQGMKVETVTDASRLQAGMLSGARAVVINNVPAHKIPATFLKAMDFFVTAQGGGLLMVGGKYSFGAGGYFQSPLDPLLPVSMELRQEHRKLAVAMALVLDRSGSMAAGAGPGVVKMDLADEGAARAIELLGPSDAVAVYAVDSEPHAIVPLAKVGGDAARMSAEVRRIQSAGGGIYVYTGLKAAWDELKKSTAGQKHIILFADAADAEEPGDYKNLLNEIVTNGGTVSVIGLGTDSDSDAAFLKDVAALGNGRIFFNADPSQLPGIFAQETVAVARSAFLSDPVPVVDAAGWLQIAARPLSWPAQVDGYNLSYLKPEATAAALSGDEYKAPLVAFWQKGAGRAAAVSFPLAGDYSASVRAWPAAGDFEQTLIRWLLPAAPPPGIGLRTRVTGEDLQVDLLHDATWTQRLAETPPRLMLVEGEAGQPFEVPWEKIEPGRYTARVAVPGGSWLRGVVRAGKETWPFGPVAAGVDPEWSFSPEQLQELRDVSRESGGMEITNLRDTWKAPRAPEYSSIGGWLLVLLLMAFLADIGVTRWRGAH